MSQSNSSTQKSSYLQKSCTYILPTTANYTEHVTSCETKCQWQQSEDCCLQWCCWCSQSDVLWTTHTGDCVCDRECCRWYISATKHSRLYLHLCFLWEKTVASNYRIRPWKRPGRLYWIYANIRGWAFTQMFGQKVWILVSIYYGLPPCFTSSRARSTIIMMSSQHVLLVTCTLPGHKVLYSGTCCQILN